MFLASLALPSVVIQHSDVLGADAVYEDTISGVVALLLSPFLTFSALGFTLGYSFSLPAFLGIAVPLANLWLLLTPVVPDRFSRIALVASAIFLIDIILLVLVPSALPDVSARLQGFYLWACSFVVSFAGFLALSRQRLTQQPPSVAA